MKKIRRALFLVFDLVIGLLLGLLIVLPITCQTAISIGRHSINAEVLTEGKAEIIKDTLGQPIELKIGDYIEELNSSKIDNKSPLVLLTLDSERLAYLKEIKEGLVYTIYMKEGKCLFWKSTRFFIESK